MEQHCHCGGGADRGVDWAWHCASEGCENVVGIGREQGSLRVARRVGAVSHTTIDLAKGVAEAELVILCTPVGKLVEHARQAAEHCPERTLVTDVGSVKRAIVESLDTGLARGCRFLGSHPLAGSEKAGAANASATLFEGRVAVLTPTKNTRAEDFDLLEEFGGPWVRWSSRCARGARPGGGGDQSSAPLGGGGARKCRARGIFRLAGPGLLDATRVAAGDPELWRQILTLNRHNLLTALEHYGKELAAIHAALCDGNHDQIARFLATAKKNRDALES